MTKKKVNLNDPDCEPTEADWAEITQSAGEKVRAETERMKQRCKEQSGSDDQDNQDHS